MPILPVTRARTANLPLMPQLGGIVRSSGNNAARISLSRSERQAAPSRAPSFLPVRNSCGATTALPDAGRGGPGVGGRRLDVGLDRLARDRKAELDELLVQADLVALGRADRPVSFAKVLLGADIVAAHGASADQLGQLVAGLDAAGPGIGVVIDADLVQLGRVDAVEPVGDVAELDRVAVPDGRGCGQRGGWSGRRETLTMRDRK